MLTTLRSISAKTALFVLALVCAASFALMMWAAHTDSAIDDELAHIPAGYGYVHNLDYRLNPEHPPLVKALAMLPVLLLQPNYPTTNPAWTTAINGQWDMGTAFLYQSGNDANAIIQTARIFPIIITLLAILLAYFLARKIMGPWWALLPAFLFAFDPTVLAHGHYVTTDVGAAFGVLLSLFFFVKYIKNPSTRNLWYAGLAFGVAQIAKFSTPLLIPLYIFLVIALWARDMVLQWPHTAHRFKKFFMSLIRYGWRLILIGVIGYVFIVYPVYFLFTINYPISRQVSDTTQILASFANGPTPAGQLCHGMRCLAELDIRMAGNPVLRPYAQYLLGLLMVLQRSDAGNTIYFLGAVRGSGGWTYFPTLYLLKEPIPTLIIVFAALIVAAWWIMKKFIKGVAHRAPGVARQIADYIGTNFTQFSMASFIVLYWTYSMRSPLNIGIRHLMPTIPLILILAASMWKQWIFKINFSLKGFLANISPESMLMSMRSTARSFIFSAIKYAVLVILVFWLFLETIFAAPYFLSYFNEFGGGTSNGYHYVTDSNYDWGQDLLRLQAFVNEHPEIDTIAVDYFGGGSPKYYLGNKEVDWWSSKGNPADHGIHWYAVSVNQLEGGTQPLLPGETRNASDSYSWLTSLRPVPPGMGSLPPPDFRVGTSIFVYHL
ncbi:MAG TPA: glycosyltransferase family 39 protein [Candidatus Paceibacterota bacterium]|nr:glycosyltransferase family 39 protein [Candidatus Paceibacterota bacterium]